MEITLASLVKLGIKIAISYGTVNFIANNIGKVYDHTASNFGRKNRGDSDEGEFKVKRSKEGYSVQ